MVVTTYGSDRDGWTVARDRMWWPGIYDAEATARRAAALDPVKLETLDRIYRADGENRPVTTADLDALRADA